jgi:hypothetical protein
MAQALVPGAILLMLSEVEARTPVMQPSCMQARGCDRDGIDAVRRPTA